METGDKISINLLLADILVFVGDESTRNYGFNRGYYVSGIQQAVEELAYDTFFDIQTVDIPLHKENKDNLAVEMPPNCFNVREMYLFDDECCGPSSSVIVHWKRLYNNRGKGAGHTAKRIETGRRQLRDAIFGTDGDVNTTSLTSLHYANIQNGLIMLSSNATGFSHLRIVFNGTAGAIGDEPIIPRFLRQAIVDFVTERTFRALMGKEPRKFSALWANHQARLTDPRNGSWIKAERRIKALSTWKRDGIREWTGRPNY